MRINLRKLRIGLLLYVAFDIFIGGYCGGFLPLNVMAAAQFTTVSGTVTDPNGLPYANGTIAPVLVISGSPTLSGLPYAPPSQPTGLNSAGSFVVQLADNTQLSPGGSQWKFLVCSGAGTIQPAGGKGPVCFSITLTISGASQDISVQLQAAALALSNISGGGTPGAPVTAVQTNQGGVFVGDANFTWDNTNKAITLGPTTYKGLFGFPLQNTPRIYLEYDSTETAGSSSGPFTFGAWFNTVAAATSISAAELFSVSGTVNTTTTNTVNYTSELVGVYGNCNHNGSGTITQSCFGVSGEAFNQSTTSGVVNNLIAVSGQAGALAGQTGVTNFAVGGNFNIYAQGNSTTPIGQGYGVRINGPVVAGASGTTMTAFSYLKMDGACPAHVGSCLIIDVTNAGQNNLGAGLTTMGLANLLNGSGTCLLTFSTSGTCFETAGTGATGQLQVWANSTQMTTTDFAFGLTINTTGGLGFGPGSTRDTGITRLAAGLLAFGTGALSSQAGFQKSAQFLSVRAADVTCGTGGTLTPCTAFTTITGLSRALPLVAADWSFKCDLVVSQATAAAADQIGVQTATNSAANMTASAQAYTAAAVVASGAIADVGVTTTPQSVITFTPGGVGTLVPIHLAGTFETVSASGTTFNVTVLTGAAADLLTIYRGSSCWVY